MMGKEKNYKVSEGYFIVSLAVIFIFFLLSLFLVNQSSNGLQYFSSYTMLVSLVVALMFLIEERL